MTSRHETPETLKTISLWHNEGNHDKLYRLEMQEFEGHYDVFCMYGRRGGELTMHVWADKVTKAEAVAVFTKLRAQKLKKGYREIVEDVMEVGKSVPEHRS